MEIRTGKATEAPKNKDKTLTVQNYHFIKTKTL